MKKTIAALLFLAVALLADTKTATADFQWQPIAKITDFEMDIIAGASLKPAERVLAGATHFSTSQRMIIILFQDNTIGFYGHSVKAYNSLGGAAEKEKESLYSQAFADKTQLDIDIEDELLRMENKFFDIWNRRDPNKLTAEDLFEADTLVEEYIALLLTAPTLNEPVETIAWIFAKRGGNRYLANFVPIIQNLPLREQADFWGEYVGSKYEARDKDLPTDNQELEAIYKMRHILSVNPTIRIFLTEPAIKEIKRLAPDIYQELEPRIK